MIPAFTGRSHWHNGMFRPDGRLQAVPEKATLGEALEGFRWDTRDNKGKRPSVLAARLFVGFNVGSKPRWTLEDLIRIVSEIREAQTGDPSSTFLAQRGIYKSGKTGKIVEEDGGQVIIIDTLGTPREKFDNQMVGLAEVIARRLKQEEVVVEIQKNGVVQRAMGVTP